MYIICRRLTKQKHTHPHTHPQPNKTPSPPPSKLTDAQVQARLQACGFAGGDLRAFAAAGGGLLAPECVLYFLTRFHQVGGWQLLLLMLVCVCYFFKGHFFSFDTLFHTTEQCNNKYTITKNKHTHPIAKQHAALMLFKYARKPPQAGCSFPRVAAAVTRVVCCPEIYIIRIYIYIYYTYI